MNSELPKKHKNDTKFNWKTYGLIWTSEEEFEDIYERYIASTNCELCDEPYKNNYDRHMDHIHYINNKWGWFRNVVCRSCNSLKYDRKQANNTSGYIGIWKEKSIRYTQGFIWVFEVTLKGKNKIIKRSVNLEYLIKFATKWKLDNNYIK